MKTWVKVAIGCFALFTIAVFLFVAGIVALGYWAKSSLEEITGGGPAVEEARKTANAVPFATPAGNAISEPRLRQFIEVRASVFSVYEKYRTEIESRVAAMKERQSLDLGDLSTGFTFLGELQKAETLALAKHGMSEAEYSFIATEVHKSLWTELGAGEAGKALMQGAAETAKTASEAMTGKGAEGLPPEAREALARAASEIAHGSREASREMASMGTTPENLALFKRYDTELRKYAMPGLTLLFNKDGPKEREAAGIPTPPPGK